MNPLSNKCALYRRNPAEPEMTPRQTQGLNFAPKHQKKDDEQQTQYEIINMRFFI